MIGIVGWFVTSKIGRLIGLVGIALAAVGYVVARIYAAGKRAERERQARKVEDVRRKWDAIDRDNADFDAALGRLRKRSGR